MKPVSVKVTSILYNITLLYIMPEEKPKRQMSPEARERMLANLKKGREAKSRKLAEAKKSKLNGTTSTHPEPERENDETKDTLGGENASSLASMKLTCNGCKKLLRHLRDERERGYVGSSRTVMAKVAQDPTVLNAGPLNVGVVSNPLQSESTPSVAVAVLAVAVGPLRNGPLAPHEVADVALDRRARESVEGAQWKRLVARVVGGLPRWFAGLTG